MATTSDIKPTASHDDDAYKQHEAIVLKSSEDNLTPWQTVRRFKKVSRVLASMKAD
jgi:hypothetical protein